uniref:Cytochrome P450 n=1 Tax=Acrobeloides nanus TaxID=290746 RepID=A0A914ELB1_9BILA
MIYHRDKLFKFMDDLIMKHKYEIDFSRDSEPRDYVEAFLPWAIVYLVHNPEVQKKITEELDREIGTDRIVDLSDKNKLHYLNAAINVIFFC